MILLKGVTFPLSDPVPIFVIFLFIILLAPIFLRKIRIPGIVGLIIAGMLIGDHGFNLVAKGRIDLFGNAGLLYIMFIAGLELDIAEFKKNRYKSLVFGFLTFIVPLSLGYLICRHLLEFSETGSLLVSSMFATHTLVAYPLVSRMGITKNEAVTITVGGTIITDTAVLLILAVLSGSADGELNQAFFLKLGSSFLIFAFAILWGFPVIGRWFFKKIKDDSTSHFVFVLAMVFLAAFLAELAGVEGIIGAFLAGLALNQLIPHTSSLMSRIEFVGNAIFIPFFLISVGMLVDLRVLLKGNTALFIASVLTVMALSTKWIAAFLTQKIFRYSSTQRNIIFGLSTSHAAATIAVILIGYNLNFVDEHVLNGTIILILVTCMVGSFVTANAGKKLAIIDTVDIPSVINIQEKILIPVNEEGNKEMLDFATMLSTDHQKAPVYMLTVMQDEDGLKQKMVLNNKNMESAIKQGAETKTKVFPITRVDLNVVNGIARAVKELLISDVVIGWSEKDGSTTSYLFNTLFGTTTQNVLESVWETVFVCRLQYPLSTTRRTFLIVPKNAEFEIGFSHWVKRITALSREAGSKMQICCTESTEAAIRKEIQKNRISIETSFKKFEDMEDLLVLSREVSSNDLMVAVSARKGTISHHSFMETLPSKLVKYFPKNNLVLLYPEQKQEAGMQLEPNTLSSIQEPIDKLGRAVKKIFKPKD
ncbi:MAG: cation:proton antiporter [Chitinophagaceae bacterium]|nr:cation:proton antiporter [Chitinophagaceae bacterium]MCW5925979.1 cation:proton antiporter [Chitinophagaceae bacterium]